MIISVELELESPNNLTAEDIEKDLRMAEYQIGWNYDYTIKSVKLKNKSTDTERSKRIYI